MLLKKRNSDLLRIRYLLFIYLLSFTWYAPTCILHWSTTILLSAFCKLIKDKSDALNPKITLVLLNQVKFLSYHHKSFLRFLLIYLASVVVYSESIN